MPHSPIASQDDLAQEAALLKAEAVLRILKGRTTVEQEASRLQVDASLVACWLKSTFRAICDAADQNLLRSIQAERHRDDADIRAARSGAANAF
ncbi:MAG TPA: hypothetical protein VHF86_03655 [Xanthomonadaceae bacterium]|nr:hypothetical protein [Xanthomonadaceae bacterium]